MSKKHKDKYTPIELDIMDKLKTENDILRKWIDQKEDAYLALEKGNKNLQIIISRLAYLMMLLEDMENICKEDNTKASGVILMAIAAFRDELTFGYYNEGKGYKGDRNELIKQLENEEQQ